MKNKLYKPALVILAAAAMHSCSLDEYNPTQVTGDEILATYSGLKGLASYCYTPLYQQLFSASDFLAVAETGTDLWLTAKNSDNTRQLFYYEGLTTNTNATNKLFKQAYSTINSCNSIIARADRVQDADPKDLRILKAEAHCLRAYYYLILTTYYGEITLNLQEITDNLDLTPQRNTYQEIYTQIVEDLNIAIENLDVKPLDGNYARVSKKTALGLLARTYVQGAGENLSENGVSYWQRAKEVTENFIENMSQYDAYLYDDVEDLWAHANNRRNKEALFVASGPHAGSDAYLSGAYSSNKLFTFTFANPNKLSDVYKIADKQNYLYGRVNNNLYAPSKYLINCFSDYDKRWENSFTSAFSAFSMVQPNWVSYTKYTVELTDNICAKYGISLSHVGKKIYPYADLAAISQGSNGGNQYVASVWPKGDHSGNIQNLQTVKNIFAHPYPLDKDEDRFAIYLSKNTLSPEDKKERAYVCVNIDDLFDASGMYKSASFDGTESYQLFPSLSKFNWSYDGVFNGGNLQVRNGDMFIMRMAEVYLIAAEANAVLGNEAKAAEHLNVLRKRATRNSEDYVQHMQLAIADIDTVLDEYARELCGEFNRWPILKRHRAIEARLKKYNPRAAEYFNPNLHYLRPISFDFLNQIENPLEYGTNGY